MAKNAPLIGREERDALFQRLASDCDFRERMKDDWRSAVAEVGINSRMLTKGELSRCDIHPLGKGDASASAIVITIFSAADAGAEKVELHDTVLFESDDTAS